MKFANVKALVVKGTVLTIAAAALTIASPVKAEAQRFAVAVRVGAPVYGARYEGYAADRRGYVDYDRRDDRRDFDRYEYARHEEFLRREAFLRHQEWQREHRYDRSYGYR